MADLVRKFEAYGAWRDAVSGSIFRLRDWLEQSHLLSTDAARRLSACVERLAEERVVIAVIAEFSRGKSELINAMFFADFGRRILPSSVGRTTMCPTELLYDESLPASIRALPIETRARRGTTSEFKKNSAEWCVFPLDTDSPEGMLDAFKLVAETIRVTIEEARLYDLYDGSDSAQAAAVDDDGTIEISRWRHAVINFPHPLLRRGLVILDTPGLNAIGTEPELTLSLVPSSHAVLYVLAADTGVTKSDLEVWQHVVGESGNERHHLAVLNKIDGLWDPLKSEAEIDGEIARQSEAVAHTLGLDLTHVFPVSAQKGLYAKVSEDPDLLARSRLPKLEHALVEMIVPHKRGMARDQVQLTLDRIAAEVRQALAARERGLIEQLHELRGVAGKSDASLDRLLARAEAEQEEFDQSARRVLAARRVLTRLADEVDRQLHQSRPRSHAQEARRRMRDSQLTPQLVAAVREFFTLLRSRLTQATAGLAEIERMVLGVHRQFAVEQGWTLAPPMTFGLESYVADLDRVEAACMTHFGLVAVVTQDKWALIQRFADTATTRTMEIFAAAQRDAEAWTRSALLPLEAQVREQRAELMRRTQGIARIRNAQESLQDRLNQLDEALTDVRGRQRQLQALLDDCLAIIGQDDSIEVEAVDEAVAV